MWRTNSKTKEREWVGRWKYEGYLKQRTKQKTQMRNDLEVFKAEIETEKPTFVKRSRKAYIKSELKTLSTKVGKDIKTVENSKAPEWVEEVLICQLGIKKNLKKIKSLTYQLNLKPQANRTSITSDDIQRAREVDIASLDLLPDIRRNGTVHKAVCPFHEDTNPSLVIYPGERASHCYVEDKTYNAIDIVMKQLDLPFIESVKYLIKF